MRKTDSWGRDPFRGYPKPSNPRWIRFTVWAMLAALLAMLVVWSILEG